MAETVKLPGVGDVKRNHLIAGLGVAGGIVGFAWWRASTAAAGATVLDPALDQLGLPGDTAGGGGYTNPDPQPPVPDPDPSTAAPRTNVEWHDRVIDKLIGTFDGAALEVAIGKYLDRQGLNAAEQQMIRTAWGSVGRPPEGNYPIVLATTSPAPPATAKPIHRMQWTQVTSTLPGTISSKQTGAAREAAALNVWKPSGTQLSAVITECAARNKMKPATVVKPGQRIWIYKAIKQG